MWWPGREGVGGYLPPACLELSKSLQMHLVRPGRLPAPPVAGPGAGVSWSSRRPPSGAAPPLRKARGVRGTRPRAEAVSRPCPGGALP